MAQQKKVKSIKKSPDERVRIVSLKVLNLFNDHNIEIDMARAGDIVGIIGENGAGKSIALRIMYAAINMDYKYFNNITFDKIEIKFSNGALVHIESESTEYSESRLKIKYISSSRKEYEGAYQVSERGDQYYISSMTIERYIPFLRRINQNTFIDTTTGGRITKHDAVERYSSKLPPSYRVRLGLNVPQKMIEFLREIDCKIVDVHRTTSTNEFQVDEERQRLRERARAGVAIEALSEDLALKVSKSIAEYGVQAQNLERSFPVRLIAEIGNRRRKAAIKINEIMDLVRKEDAELQKLGILDDNILLPFDEGGVTDKQIMRMLLLYMVDNQKKLSFLSEIKNKMMTFLEIVNSAMRNKQVKFSRKAGLQMLNKSGAEIPLSGLSTGEQHYIVLMYRLIFMTGKNSIVLIDEPELSLHASWQVDFMSNVMKIQALMPFQVIMATHSYLLLQSDYDNVAVEI